MIKFRSALAEEVLLPQSDYIDYYTLAADTHEAHAVPSGARYAKVTAASLAYAKPTATSFALPSGDITDGTGPITLPANVAVLIDLRNGTSLGLRAAGTPIVEVQYFG